LTGPRGRYHSTPPEKQTVESEGATEVKLGLVTYQLGKDWDVPTIVDKLTALEYEGVELRTQHAHGVEDTLSKEQRVEVRRRFADSPIELVGLGSTFEYHALDANVVRDNIEGTKRYCELAKDVGAQGVKVRPNGHQEAAGVPREQTLTQIGLALRECGQAAADNGVLIRLEMHGTVGDAVDMRKVIDVTDHPNVWLCWNSNARFDVDESGSVKRDYDLVKDKIGLVHLHDLTDETYPWPELLGLLKHDGYQGYCLAECAPPSSDPERVLQYFRALYYAFGG
jgi:sugar phosphate isomerase/epimerase